MLTYENEILLWVGYGKYRKEKNSKTISEKKWEVIKEKFKSMIKLQTLMSIKRAIDDFRCVIQTIDDHFNLDKLWSAIHNIFLNKDDFIGRKRIDKNNLYWNDSIICLNKKQMIHREPKKCNSILLKGSCIRSMMFLLFYQLIRRRTER
jgi:hypothetical protein